MGLLASQMSFSSGACTKVVFRIAMQLWPIKMANVDDDDDDYGDYDDHG